jgi:hypothetical protein
MDLPMPATSGTSVDPRSRSDAATARLRTAQRLDMDVGSMDITNNFVLN